MRTPLIVIENLSITFQHRGEKINALSGINLSINTGDIVALAGETGSGKSTLARAILGSLPTDVTQMTGDITYHFNKQRPQKQPDGLLGKKITCVLQNPLLAMNPTMRCGKQIEECLPLEGKTSQSDRKARVLRLLEKYELEDPDRVYRSYPHQLSIGQLQRVMIAMALAPNPELIIADEPFTSVDTITRLELLKLFQAAIADRQLTLLLISHDLQIIDRIAKKWCMLKEGNLLAQGSTPFLSKEHREEYLQILTASYQKLQQPGKFDSNVQFKRFMSFNDVSFRYHDGKSDLKAALHQISFRILRGEIFGIVGRSGSGKSTIARILGGLLRGYEGEVILDGTEIGQVLNHNRMGYYKRIQYLLQDAASALPPRIRVGYLLQEALRTFRGLESKEIRTLIQEILAFVGLPTSIVNRYRGQLSGGQMQRVALARALCADPDLLILDESLTALDKSVQFEMVTLLKRVNEQEGKTIILVSHDLALIRHLCHRVLVVNAGRVEESGRTEEVLTRSQSKYIQALVNSS